MMLFSQRKGLTKVKDLLQKDGMDIQLRNGLWNCLILCYFKHFNGSYDHIDHSNLEEYMTRLWHHYFKTPLDTMPFDFESASKMMREIFFKMQWYEVYDFIEFTIQNGPADFAHSFRWAANDILARENSAYRFVENEIVEITSQVEIDSIEEALHSVSRYSGIKAHLSQALILMSDRKNPDYRNSIKESISAVEALSQLITGDMHATLGAAIKILDPTLALHPAFRDAISKLYGYASDADGIRHAMLEESSLTYSDAKFMLVACSGFVNYIIGKCAENNIKC